MPDSGISTFWIKKILDLRYIKLYRKTISFVRPTRCLLCSTCLQVALGTCEDGRPLVGYLFNTHLQAYQGENGTLCDLI